jgi:hypothetical protein
MQSVHDLLFDGLRSPNVSKLPDSYAFWTVNERLELVSDNKVWHPQALQRYVRTNTYRQMLAEACSCQSRLVILGVVTMWDRRGERYAYPRTLYLMPENRNLVKEIASRYGCETEEFEQAQVPGQDNPRAPLFGYTHNPIDKMTVTLIKNLKWKAIIIDNRGRKFARVVDLDYIAKKAVLGKQQPDALTYLFDGEHIVIAHGGDVPNSYRGKAWTDAVVAITCRQESSVAVLASRIPANKCTYAGVAVSTMGEWARAAGDRRFSSYDRDMALRGLLEAAREITAISKQHFPSLTLT